MKKIIMAVCLAALLPVLCLGAARARGHSGGRGFGAGIVIGSPTGINGKYWLGARHAIDGTLSVLSKDEVYLHGDFLWHDYAAFPKPEEGRLPLYYGVGGVLTSERLGVRGVIGISYIFDGYPFDIFLELAPVMYIYDTFDLRFTGGLGARYYFR
jgi:hypothetical protein